MVRNETESCRARLIFLYVTVLSLLVMTGCGGGVHDVNKAYFMSLENGDSKEIIALLTGAIESGTLPRNELATAYNNRGWEYAKLGDFAAAFSDLKKALEYHSRKALFFNNTAYVAIKLGRFEDAIAYADKAVELNIKWSVKIGDSINAYHLKAAALRGLRRYQEAAAVLEVAIMKDPGNSKLYTSLARMYATALDQEGRNPAKALEYARKSCAIENKYSNLDALSSAYAINGMWDEAVSNQEKAIQKAKKAEVSDRTLKRYYEKLNFYRKHSLWVE